ncbi:AraC family transcriptional regulator [Roseibium sp.]|uniref:AraC family transcriptional regulator n=1 Tax=Roseibium sp. TaxID=1936156 RepID=UPI00391890E2
MMAQPQRPPPLSDFRRFQTLDVDAARDIVARHFCSHKLERQSSDDRFDACQHRVTGEHVSLNYLRYGGDVTIEPGELTRFFLIQIPLTGAAEITNGCQAVASNTQTASILNPDRHTVMRWHSGCEQLLVQIDRQFVDDVASSIAGMDLGAQLRFAPEFLLKRPEAHQWMRKLWGLVHAAENGELFGSDNRTSQLYLEEELIVSLLEVQENTASVLLSHETQKPGPAILKRAIDMIHDRLQEDISLIELSNHAGTTPRNLQLVFKREMGLTPVQYLQQCRLNLARHLLLARNGDLPVSDVAELSGHRHLGRFSVAYKKRFGESPKATARSRVFC